MSEPDLIAYGFASICLTISIWGAAIYMSINNLRREIEILRSEPAGKETK